MRKSNMDEKTVKGIRQRIERGEFVGRTPWGYIRDDEGNLIIEPKAAEIVVDIYDRYYNGDEDYHEIARNLNNEGILRWGKYKFHAVTVKRILEAIVYRGKLSYKGEIYPGNHEAIIKEEFTMPGDFAKAHSERIIKDTESIL